MKGDTVKKWTVTVLAVLALAVIAIAPVAAADVGAETPIDPNAIELAITTMLTLGLTHVLRKMFSDTLERPETQRRVNFWGSGVIAVVAGFAADWLLGGFSLAGGAGKAILGWLSAQGIRRFKKGAGIA